MEDKIVSHCPAVPNFLVFYHFMNLVLWIPWLLRRHFLTLLAGILNNLPKKSWKGHQISIGWICILEFLCNSILKSYQCNIIVTILWKLKKKMSISRCMKIIMLQNTYIRSIVLVTYSPIFLVNIFNIYVSSSCFFDRPATQYWHWVLQTICQKLGRKKPVKVTK